MVKTQIYLTETEHSALNSLAIYSGKKFSVLIREAVDSYIQAKQPKEDWKNLLKNAAGMWADRDDLPDFEALRKEADREFP